MSRFPNGGSLVAAEGAKKPLERLHLADRLALTVPEAAESIGVSESHLRNILPDIPHLYLGKRLVIPVKPFEEWLREQAKAEAGRADRMASKILDDLDGFE